MKDVTPNSSRESQPRPTLVREHNTQNTQVTAFQSEDLGRRGAVAGQPPRVRWTEINNFVVCTVLGVLRAPAIALDDASKRVLDIPIDHLVLLPGEDRRVRMSQVKDYCDRVLQGGERVSGFEVVYLIELLDLTRDDVASYVGLKAAPFDALIDEDDAFSADDSARLGLYFLHAWSLATGRIRYSS